MKEIKYGVGVVQNTSSSLAASEYLASRLKTFDNICNVATQTGCSLVLMPEFSLTSVWALQVSSVVKINKKLTGLLLKAGDREKVKEYGVLLPRGSSEGNNLFKELREISTREEDMITGFNVSEIDAEQRLYNTTIVFSNTGVVLAAYRKENVWFTKSKLLVS